MRLALAAGCPDQVDALAARLSGRQVLEWQAFELIEGGVGGRAVWQAMTQFLLYWANAHRDPKRRSQPFRERDFLPWLKDDERTPKMTMKAFRAAFAPIVVKKPKKKK